MFQDFLSKSRLKSSLKNKQGSRISAQSYDALVDIVDEQIFNQNLAQLESKIGLQHINHRPQTFKDLKHYLNDIIGYPSNTLAEIHRSSHRLGNHDIQILKTQFSTGEVGNRLSLVQSLQHCPCCGLRKQDQELKICSMSMQNMEIVGTSAYMLLRTERNLGYFLILALIVFGIFSFATNIRCSQIWTEIGRQNLFPNIIKISLGSKIYLTVQQNNSDLLIVQVWLGFVFVCLLTLGYLWMQRVQAKNVKKMQGKTITVADYSIVLKGVPIDVTKQEIEQNLNQLCGLLGQANEQRKPQILKVAKINTASPIHVQAKLKQKLKSQLKQINDSLKALKKQIVLWVMQLASSDQFQTPQDQRRSVQRDYLKKFEENEEKKAEIISKVKKTYQDKNSNLQNLTHCFVTFQSTWQKQKVFELIEDTAFDKVLRYASFALYLKTAQMRLGQQKQLYKVQIQQADQPQDVLWENIGLSTMKLAFRKCITFFYTFLILGASFAAVYGLSTVQRQNKDNQYISFLISLSIVIFNWIISCVLGIFTSLQNNSSYTKFQSSYAVKSIIAQIINTILIPILVNIFLKSENFIYTKSGLADDVFLLGLTNAFVPPILKIFDVQYFIYHYVMVWYYKKPQQKFYLDQNTLNKIYELMFFDIGYEYTYVISLYLWTCFFMPLQPIVIVFSIAGLFLNYWAQKYCLFNRCKRPVPGTRVLYNVMMQFLYAGGLFYSFGSLTFINFIPKSLLFTELKFALIANIISIIIASISLFIPYSYIFGKLFEKKQMTSDFLYENQRILFPSQYDRANPATMEKGLQDYFAFVNQKKTEIQKKLKQNKNDKQVAELINKLEIQERNLFIGSQSLGGTYKSSLKGNQDNLFKSKPKIIAPSSIKNYLIEDVKQQIGKSHKQAEPKEQNNFIESIFKKGMTVFGNKQNQKLDSRNFQPQYSQSRLVHEEQTSTKIKGKDSKFNIENVSQQTQKNQTKGWWQILADIFS